MKQLLLVWLLLVSNSLLAKEVFTANYDLYWGGMKVGAVTRKLVQNGNTYSFSSVAKPYGLAKLFVKSIVEKSRFHTKGNEFLPLAYFYEQRGRKNRTIKHRYQWGSKTLYIDKPNKLRVKNMAANAIDLLSFQYFISKGLAGGKGSFVRSVYRKSKDPSVYTLIVRGKESVKTPAGKYNATKVVRMNAKGHSFKAWCAEKLGFIPVKIEYTTKKGQLTKMILTKINRN